MLGKMGHSVVLAENGQEGVDKWRATLSSEALKLLPLTPHTAAQTVLLTVSAPLIDTSLQKISTTQQTESSGAVASSCDVAGAIVNVSPPSAILKLPSTVFDICLMDLSMPVYIDMGHSYNCGVFLL